jgi:hypothetical protein
MRLDRFALSFVAVLALGAGSAQADSGHVRLWTLFTGQGRCLDIINDHDRDKLVMADCGNYTGQQWTLLEAEVNNRVRLQNEFSGVELCLDVINDDLDDKPVMAKCGNYTGQLWTVTQSLNDAGFLQLSNDFTGAQKCLDIVNDREDEKLKIAGCGNYSGQMWHTDPAD